MRRGYAWPDVQVSEECTRKEPWVCDQRNCQSGMLSIPSQVRVGPVLVMFALRHARETPMSISRYIAVALVIFSRASSVSPMRAVEFAEAEMAVGGERAHP